MNQQPEPPAPAGSAKKNEVNNNPTQSPGVSAPEAHSEEALDHALEESFPASDPVSVDITKVPAPPAKKPT